MSAARLVVAVGLVLALATGCGGSGGSGEADVEDTVTTYLTAFASGDGRKACEQLTGSEALLIFEEALVALPELQARSCSDALSTLAGNLGGAEKEALESAEVERVKVNGDIASAMIVGATRPAQLEKVGGRWVISGGVGLSP